jgi:hypothetical protein
MLGSKTFWIGFLVAYAVAVVLPPKRLLSMGKRQGG